MGADTDDGVSDVSRSLRRLLPAAGYVIVLSVALLLFAGILRFGETLSAPAALSTLRASGPQGTSRALEHLLVALVSVMTMGLLVGRLMRRLSQPPVMAEVVAGLLLGPSVLGAVFPAAYRFILPSEIAPHLGSVAQLGIVFYMFIVGVDLNPALMRDRFRVTLFASHASIVVPFLLGGALSLYLFPRFSTSDVRYTDFAIFIAITMSITAFPVLARILSELGLMKTELGAMAITVAAVDDITAWCLLAIAIGVVKASLSAAIATTLLAATFVLVMVFVVKPWVERLVQASKDRAPDHQHITAAVVGLLLCALATEAIGIHALFGAFLFGVVIPHDSQLAGTIVASFDKLVRVLFLPAFFALTGMRTDIGLVTGWDGWLTVALIFIVATAGKFGGTLVAAYYGGLSLRSSAALGVLMNTRGLMQLIVLTIGLDLGLLSPTLFTMMVLMAIVSTMGAAPILRRLLRFETAPSPR